VSRREVQCDLIVLGFSLEAAFAAALVARRGWKVVWLGKPPVTSFTVGGVQVNGVPSLIPSKNVSPALSRALAEVELLPANEPLGTASSWQLLADRTRATMPSDAATLTNGKDDWESLKILADAGMGLTSEGLSFGFFPQRTFASKLRPVNAKLDTTTPLLRSATLIESAFGLGSSFAAAQTLVDPMDLPGGALALARELQRKCIEFGGQEHTLGTLQTFDIGWSGVKIATDSGQTFAGKVALLAIDDDNIDRIIPPSARPQRYFTVEPVPLYRVGVLLRSRGVPVALGRFAVSLGANPFFIERQRLDATRECLSLYWRDDGSNPAQRQVQVLEELYRLLPFSEEYVQNVADAAPVPGHTLPKRPRKWKLARRLLDARGPLLGLGGIEGAALTGGALAERIMRLAPQKPPAR
jgi:hypothetical protein